MARDAKQSHTLAVLIRDAADHIQQDIRGQLLPRLEHVRDRTPIDFGEWLESKEQLRIIMLEAIDALAPGKVRDAELWTLLGKGSDGRGPAARLIGRRQDVSHIDILACMAQDEASVVRAAAAFWIAKWLANA